MAPAPNHHRQRTWSSCPDRGPGAVVRTEASRAGCGARQTMSRLPVVWTSAVMRRLPDTATVMRRLPDTATVMRRLPDTATVMCDACRTLLQLCVTPAGHSYS
ncbi:hypothetical protein ACOMHN_003741 [Nucella lapillus]